MRGGFPLWPVFVVVVSVMIMWPDAPDAFNPAYLREPTMRSAERILLHGATGRIQSLEENVKICHERLDTITEVIRVIEKRRGNEPPRTLDEQRRYIGTPMPPYVPDNVEAE